MELMMLLWVLKIIGKKDMEEAGNSFSIRLETKRKPTCRCPSGQLTANIELLVVGERQSYPFSSACLAAHFPY